MHKDVMNSLMALLSDGEHRCEQLANLGDFISYKGLKRVAEYFALRCIYDRRNISRHLINIIGSMPKTKAPADMMMIDAKFHGIGRAQVDPASRKAACKKIIEDVHTFVSSFKKELEKSYTSLMADGEVACAKFIACLIACYTKELKYLERRILSYHSADYDSVYMNLCQDELHDCYKDKIKKLKVGGGY